MFFCWLSMWWWTGRNTTLFICCSPHCPPLLLVSLPQIPPSLGDWESVAQGSWYSGLEIPDSKLQEMKQQSYTERGRSHLVGEYWVNTLPNASWRRLADVLYKEGEDSALLMVKQYLPKGMCIFLTTWNWTSVLWYLHSNYAHQYSLAYLCSDCILHAWILYLSVHVPIVTHDHNHIMVAMQETWFTTTHM